MCRIQIRIQLCGTGQVCGSGFRYLPTVVCLDPASLRDRDLGRYCYGNRPKIKLKHLTLFNPFFGILVHNNIYFSVYGFTGTIMDFRRSQDKLKLRLIGKVGYPFWWIKKANMFWRRNNMKAIGTTDVDPDPGFKKTPKMRTRIAEKMREKNVNFYLNLIPVFTSLYRYYKN